MQVYTSMNSLLILSPKPHLRSSLSPLITPYPIPSSPSAMTTPSTPSPLSPPLPLVIATITNQRRRWQRIQRRRRRRRDRRRLAGGRQALRHRRRHLHEAVEGEGGRRGGGRTRRGRVQGESRTALTPVPTRGQRVQRGGDQRVGPRCGPTVD